MIIKSTSVSSKSTRHFFYFELSVEWVKRSRLINTKENFFAIVFPIERHSVHVVDTKTCCVYLNESSLSTQNITFDRAYNYHVQSLI